MVNNLLKKHEKLAFMCDSADIFFDCVEFILDDAYKPKIISKELRNKNKKFIKENFIPKINGKCYCIISKDNTGCDNGLIVDAMNYDEFKDYSDRGNLKIVYFNIISRKNKLKKLNAKT